jgi:hypothetical protein
MSGSHLTMSLVAEQSTETAKPFPSHARTVASYECSQPMYSMTLARDEEIRIRESNEG